METSYHDMNQKPGTLMGWSSCQSPPRYQAGSFGVRLIIAPPVETSIWSAKIPCGASTALRMSIFGRCVRAFAQSTGRQLLGEIERLRSADHIFLRRVRRKHGAHLVLLTIEPGNEKHLHGAAAIPVTLLIIRTYAPHACAEPLRDHSRECGISLSCDTQLPFGGGRTANGADFAIRPGLRRHPRDGKVGTIGCSSTAEWQ